MKMWHTIRIPCCLVDGGLAQTISMQYRQPNHGTHATSYISLIGQLYEINLATTSRPSASTTTSTSFFGGPAELCLNKVRYLPTQTFIDICPQDISQLLTTSLWSVVIWGTRENTSLTYIWLWFDIAQRTIVITISSIIITLADSHCLAFQSSS